MHFIKSPYEGRAEKVARRLERMVTREAGLDEQVTCQWDQQRPTLDFMATFLAPLNDTPSHVYLLRIPWDAATVVVEVHVDGDRGTPLGVYLSGPTRFQPRQHIVYRRGLVRGKFPEGAEEDIEGLQEAPGVSRLLRKCTNPAYSGVINPTTELHITPTGQGAEVIALRMPAEKWLFFDEVGVRPFLRLLAQLDGLAEANGGGSTQRE